VQWPLVQQARGPDREQGLHEPAAFESIGEQWLEEVVVAPVDQRQLDRRLLAEPSGCIQPGEPAADDDDAVPPCAGIPPPIGLSFSVRHSVILPPNRGLGYRDHASDRTPGQRGWAFATA